MTPSEISLNLHLDRELVSREKNSERILEVAVRAPQFTDKRERLPLNLALVLDRSGSMSGAKLKAVKQAALHVLDQLGPEDRVAIVCYDGHVEVVAPSTLVTDMNRMDLKNRVHAIDIGGSTALHDGWLTGCRQVAEFIKPETLNRCLLLTDGLANVGLTDPEAITNEAKELFDRQISTSTFGVGEGFNEHLLERMANQGGGNFYFIETPADITRIFEREFKELAETSTRDVEVTLSHHPSLTSKVLGGWRTNSIAPGNLRLSLGNLTSNQERMVYVKFTIPAAVDGITDLPVKAHARGKGKDAVVFEAEADVQWRYASQAEADAEQPDKAFMERFAPVELAEEANEALKLEREGRRREAEERLASTIHSRQAYLDNEQQGFYRDMSERMGRGMDEGDRKRSHFDTYNIKQGRKNGEYFHLERPTRHVVIDVDGRKVLIDTGSPVSIGKLTSWTFLGRPVNLLEELHGFNLDYLSQQVGMPLDVLMGMDVLKDYNLLIDDQVGTVIFSPDGFMMPYITRLPLTEYLMKVPAVEVEVEGHQMKLVLDTGARFSFLPNNFIIDREEKGKEHDFYPGIGEFDTPIYSVPMRLNGEMFLLTCGILPPTLEMALQATGVNGLLGMDLLDRYVLQLALRDNLLMLS